MPMPDWTTCPSCQLRHTRRPNGTCPRCKKALDLEAEAADQPSEGVVAGMGKLAQSARSEKLKGARGTMWAVGLLTIVANAVFFALAGGQVDDAINKELAQVKNPALIDRAKVKEIRDQAVRTVHLMNGAGVLLGLAFIGCALAVDKHPVPATVTALALYLAGTAIFGIMDPKALTTGIFLKVIITIGLFKAVQAAVAHQKEAADAGGA